MVAFALSVLIPVPLFSPDGGAYVPAGMFLLAHGAFPTSLAIVGIPTAVLMAVFSLIAWIAGTIKRRITKRGQQPTPPYSEPATRPPQG